MAVDSYIEMYTTLLGWLFYNVLWDVLTASGMVLLPFVGIIIDNFIESYREYSPRDAGPIALRAMEVDVFIGLFVVMLAGSPYFDLEATEVEFTPPDSLDLTSPHDTINATDIVHTTYGAIAFVGQPESVRVPPWWYGVMQVSRGISHAVREGIPNKLNFREYIKTLNLVHINDPLLRNEVNEFWRDCFLPARSKWKTQNPSAPEITTLFDTHGIDDTEYIGSRVYMAVLGYYNEFRSSNLIERFPYNNLRDVEWDANVGDIVPLSGRPTCQQWWLGDGDAEGLKELLIDDMSTVDRLMTLYDPFADDTMQEDTLIKKVLVMDDSVGIWMPRDYDHSYSNIYSPVPGNIDDERFVKNVVGFAGISIVVTFFMVFLDVFLKASHLIQAFFLMGIYCLLPIAVIISRYRLSILMSGGMLIFTVTFWTALWSWANFFDQALIQSLYPVSGEKTLLSLVQGNMQKEMLLNFIAGFNYILLTTLLSLMLAIGGYNAGRHLDGMVSGITGRLGQAGGMAAKGIGKLK